nr:MAG TPA: hypothetical protein [Caudoviricetes sp.]
MEHSFRTRVSTLHIQVEIPLVDGKNSLSYQVCCN